MKKNIFIFDQNKCVGCHACVVACMNENGFQAIDQWRNVYKSDNLHFPHLPLFYLSLACNHCDEAPCLKNCPALAYSRDEKTGAVIHHTEKCIGCKYCTWACPYDAPKYNPKQGVIEKCTFCNHKIEEDLKPACTNLCPTGALDFTNKEFNRKSSKKNSPLPVDIGSKIEIIKLRKTESPEIDLNLFKSQPVKITQNKKHPKISAKKEWPLVIFTLLCSIIVSFYASGETATFSSAGKFTYMGTGIFAALLSMIHLGKKNRVWRSILNPNHSWLSKEIITFSLFLGSIFIEFFLHNIPDILVIFFGFTLLISIDMLYRLATWQWPLKIHSAHTLFIGITLYSVLADSLSLFAFILAFRLTIYTYRILKLYSKISVLNVLRLLFALSSISFLLSGQHYIYSIMTLSIGEIIDRIEFYNELKIANPSVEFINN